MTLWSDIAPADAVDIDLSRRVDIRAPRNELGEPCPWPWEPQQLRGVPLGQFHCGYCGGMQVAGQQHLNWTKEDLARMEAEMDAAAARPPHDPEDPFAAPAG